MMQTVADRLAFGASFTDENGARVAPSNVTVNEDGTLLVRGHQPDANEIRSLQDQLRRHLDGVNSIPIVVQDRWRDRAIFLAVTRVDEYRDQARVSGSRECEKNIAAADAIDKLVKELQEL